jgi:hypothetical protein
VKSADITTLQLQCLRSIAETGDYEESRRTRRSLELRGLVTFATIGAPHPLHPNANWRTTPLGDEVLAHWSRRDFTGR